VNRWYLIAVFAVCGVAVYRASAREVAEPQHASETNPSSKPVRVIEFHIDGGQQPFASADEMWNASDIIVEGIVRSETPIDDLVTSYQVQLLEMYKPDSRVGPGSTAITVSRTGGVRDKGAYIEKRVEKGFPLFERGEHYILCLKALPNGTYTLNAEGAFLITPTDVKPRGHSEVGQAYSLNPELFRLMLRGKRGVR
jgi:hypothetical protein